MTRKPKRATGKTLVEHWRKQLDSNLQFAEGVLKDKGSLMPMFVIHTHDPDKPDVIIGTPWRDDDDKDKHLTIVRLLAIIHDAEAVTHLSEAWQRVVDKRHGETAAEQEERVYAVRPSQAEDRIEIVISTTTYRNEAGEHKTIAIAREIERRANGKVSGLIPIKSHQGHGEFEMTGRIVEILPPQRFPPHIRQQAQEALDAYLKVSGGQMHQFDNPKEH